MEWEVKATEAGTKLITFLKGKLEDQYSAKYLKKVIESNHCRINGRTERFASVLLGKGDVVEISLSNFSVQTPNEVSNSPEVLYEDDDFLIINKPAGVSSDSEKILQSLPSSLTLHLLHRLDKDTTGVLMFAKNLSVKERVIGYFRKHLVKKSYLALADGVFQKKSGTVDNYLGKLRIYQGQTIWGSVPQEKGLNAVTAWQVESSGSNATLVRCFPKTGRTHQLRVHLSGLGHPILGDFQYGKKFCCTYQPSRYLLHAVEISFFDEGRQIYVKAPLPKDLLDAINQLIPKHNCERGRQ